MPKYEKVNLQGPFFKGGQDNNPLYEMQRRMTVATEFADQLILPWRHAPPSKFRPGMVVLADGTDWDPGSGMGMYVRNEANDAWLFCALV